jgi:uncharacterized protein (TIGR00725 family)
MPIVAFFGSSKYVENSKEYIACEKIALKIAKNGHDIITGGYGGIMEAGLKGALDHNVNRIAVIAKELSNRKVNQYAKEIISKDTYLERLIELTSAADAYIVFPGGTGTLAELSLVWALKERKIFGNKPIVCYGDQWNEVQQIMSFYSETVIDNSDLLFHTCEADEAADFIIEALKS